MPPAVDNIGNPFPVEPDGPPKNKNGQSMYRKGEETRRRLLNATAELLKDKSFTDLTVIEIARAAQCSKPNFYLYFDGVLDAVLGAVQDVSMGTPELLALVNRNWPERMLASRSLQFVTSYIAHWRENAHVLKVRVAMVANGDPRFYAAELRASEALLLALARKIALARGPGKDSIQCPHAASTAGALLAMLERLAAFKIDESAPTAGITDARVMQAAAGMLMAVLRPQVVAPAAGAARR